MADIDQILAGGAGASSRATIPDFSGILDSFYKGRDQAYQQQGRDLLKGGVPTTDGQPNGPPDFGAMGKLFFQHGDVGQGVSLSNLALQQQNLAASREGANYGATGQPGGGPAQAPIISPSASRTNGVADPSIRPPNRGQQAPDTSTTGAPGSATIAQVLTAQGIPNDQISGASASLARQIGLDDPAQTFDPQDQRIRGILAPAIQQMKRMGIGQVIPASAQTQAPQEMPPQSVQQGQPVPQPQAAPQAPNPFANAVAAGLIPPGVDPVRYVAGLKYRAAALLKGPAQESLQKQVDEIDKASQPTDDMKAAASMGQSLADFNRSKEETKNDVTRFAKQAEGIDASAAAATSMIPHLQLARSLMSQPGFYSGTGEGVNLAYKRAIAAFGGDPNASLPQEGFRKVMAANILDQVAQLKAETAASGGSTRIFQSQIALMEKAAQNPDNSIAANRLLTEMGFRAANRAQEIANMADNYNGGHLNPQFNMKLRQWNASHPMFTPEEMADPRLIAPPEFKDARTAFDAKLPKGTPLKIDGKLKWVQ